MFRAIILALVVSATGALSAFADIAPPRGPKDTSIRFLETERYPDYVFLYGNPYGTGELLTEIESSRPLNLRHQGRRVVAEQILAVPRVEWDKFAGNPSKTIFIWDSNPPGTLKAELTSIDGSDHEFKVIIKDGKLTLEEKRQESEQTANGQAASFWSTSHTAWVVSAAFASLSLAAFGIWYLRRTRHVDEAKSAPGAIGPTL